MATFHLIIKGKVQGVFYRASAKKIAIQHGITGWIRNTKEGHVEIMAQGSEQQLRKFIAWCGEGPAGASVDNVVEEKVDEQDFAEFMIRR